MGKNAELHCKAARKAILRCYSNYEIRTLVRGVADRNEVETIIMDNWAQFSDALKDKFSYVWTRAE